MRILTFDIGGTTMRAASYHPTTDSIRQSTRCDTPGISMNPDADMESIEQQLFERLYLLGRQVMGDTPPEVVTLGFPGPITPEGEAIAAPTIWGDRFKHPINLKEKMRGQWPTAKIYVMNDVTAAGYRYMRHSKESFAIITISSGIGSKIFIDGMPVVGPNGRGGEIGHVCIDDSEDAPFCECGNKGHLAAFTSGRASRFQATRLAEQNHKLFEKSEIGRLLNGDVGAISNALIVRCFHAGDYWTTALMRAMTLPLSRMLAIQHLSLGIERFVLVGGFALAAGEAYRQLVASSAQKMCWRLSGDWDSMVELGVQDDDAGLIGGGRYVARSSGLTEPAF